MTGTFREMSGFTVPVTTSFGAAAYSTAAASGNCSGWSTEKRLTSVSANTVAGGGASAAGFPCALLHPPRKRSTGMKIKRKLVFRPLFFMGTIYFSTANIKASGGGGRQRPESRSGLETLPLLFTPDRPRLELDHDGESQGALILPQVWAEPASCNTGETRRRGQEGSRHECCARHQRSGSRVGNRARCAVDTGCYPTATRKIGYVCVAIAVLPAEGDVLFRHIVEGDRSIPSLEGVAGIRRKVRRSGERISSVDRWDQHEVAARVVHLSTADGKSIQVLLEPPAVVSHPA